jgi:hypothetical protein
LKHSSNGEISIVTRGSPKAVFGAGDPVCDHLLVAPLNNPGGDRQVIEKVSLRLVRHLLVEPYDDPAT